MCIVDDERHRMSRQPPLRPKGYGGVGPSPVLALLLDAHGIASSRCLGSGPTALVTRHAVVLQQPSK